MDTQTTEASEQSTILSAATDDIDHSTVSASPSVHVEQLTVSASPTDHIEQPTVSASLTDHIDQPTVSAGLTDHVEKSAIHGGLTDQVEQSGISTSLTDQVEQSTVSALVHHSHNDLVSELPNHSGMENKYEIAEVDVRSILEGIASTGKCCLLPNELGQRSRDHWNSYDVVASITQLTVAASDLDIRKCRVFVQSRENTLSKPRVGEIEKHVIILSKAGMVLSEYPEARMNSDVQRTTLGESYIDLAKRLDDALDSFVEGPPFTIQRLSEILLGAQNIYPKLSKLALALEKNLLVTSTLSISSDSQPSGKIETPVGPEKAIEEPQQLQPDLVQNGVEPMVADSDEIMADVEADVEANDDMTIDMAFEEIVKSSEESSARSTGNNS